MEACHDGDVGAVRRLLTEGRSVHETSEEGESLLSLACSAGYYELAQVSYHFFFFGYYLNYSFDSIFTLLLFYINFLQ